MGSVAACLLAFSLVSNPFFAGTITGGFVNLIWPLSIISFGPTPGLLMIAGFGWSGALLRP
jgi:hypothetical protein